jgi:hypothetical protein
MTLISASNSDELTHLNTGWHRYSTVILLERDPGSQINGDSTAKSWPLTANPCGMVQLKLENGHPLKSSMACWILTNSLLSPIMVEHACRVRMLSLRVGEYIRTVSWVRSRLLILMPIPRRQQQC